MQGKSRFVVCWFGFLLPLAVMTGGLRGQTIKFDGLGVVNLQVKNISYSRPFYTAFLGFDEAFDLRDSQGKVKSAFFKVNENQYVELTAAPPGCAGDQLLRIGILSPDLHGLRHALLQHNLKPTGIKKGPDGSPFFSVTDPDGTRLDFLRFTRRSLEARSKGRFLSDRRISQRLLHTGINVSNLSAAMAFYRGMLQFHVGLLVAPRGHGVRWIHVQMPGPSGDDIEFNLRPSVPHICFATSNMQQTYRELVNRGMRQKPRPFVGPGGHWLMNVFDPDGIRIEFMGPEATK